ncbi:hypothetical protein Kallioja_00003 [Pseudomonas phage vB_PpuP-Kallioja]
MARIHNVTANQIALLDGLDGDTIEACTAEAIALSKFSLSLKKSPKFIKVTHRELSYTIGRWHDWQGPVWMVEDSTGIIYRGTFTDVKDFLILCSEAHYNPHGIAKH